MRRAQLGDFAALVGGSGPPLLYLHGFPDHPPTARAFLARLAARRTVYAPWLRGYAPSPRGGAYDLDALVGDVRGMVERIGAPLDVVGHDWGAMLAYGLCAIAPRLVRRAVTLALPHPLTFLSALRTLPQARMSWYMALFQLPGAGALVRARDLALIDRLWRTWSPTFALPAADRAELHACLAASLPAPLSYYRALVRPSAVQAALAHFRAPLAPPILQLHGALDGCIAPPTSTDSHRFCERALEIIPGAGHFLHLELPDAIAARALAWLA